MAKNKDKDVLVDVSEDVDSELRVYELGFHLDPELPVEEMKKTYQKIHDFIDDKGTIIAEGEPKKIQLAYTISRQEVAGRRDFDSAYFSWIAYEAYASSHSEIITMANAQKHIIRFIDILTTKDIARHAVEVSDLSIKAPEQAEDSEVVADIELETALENVVV